MRKGSKKETPPDPAPETPRGGVPENVPSPAGEDCLEERLAARHPRPGAGRIEPDIQRCSSRGDVNTCVEGYRGPFGQTSDGVRVERVYRKR